MLSTNAVSRTTMPVASKPLRITPRNSVQWSSRTTLTRLPDGYHTWSVYAASASYGSYVATTSWTRKLVVFSTAVKPAIFPSPSRFRHEG